MGRAIAPIARPSRSPSDRVNAGGGTAGNRSDTGIRLALWGFDMRSPLLRHLPCEAHLFPNRFWVHSLELLIRREAWKQLFTPLP